MDKGYIKINKWLLQVVSKCCESKASLIHFQYASGNSSIYSNCANALPSAIDLVTVQLHRCSERFVEPPIDNMDRLVDELVIATKNLLYTRDH